MIFSCPETAAGMAGLFKAEFHYGGKKYLYRGESREFVIDRAARLLGILLRRDAYEAAGLPVPEVPKVEAEVIC